MGVLRVYSNRNDLRLGTAVVLNTMLQPTDFGFKKSRVRVRIRESAPIYLSR